LRRRSIQFRKSLATGPSVERNPRPCLSAGWLPHRAWNFGQRTLRSNASVPWVWPQPRRASTSRMPHPSPSVLFARACVLPAAQAQSAEPAGCGLALRHPRGEPRVRAGGRSRRPADPRGRPSGAGPRPSASGAPSDTARTNCRPSTAAQRGQRRRGLNGTGGGSGAASVDQQRMPPLLRHHALGECVAARLETVGRACRAKRCLLVVGNRP
jgi:hypothetical protein